jgi:hypothetical protein
LCQGSPGAPRTFLSRKPGNVAPVGCPPPHST